MPFAAEIATALVAITVASIALIALRPALVAGRAGKAMAFLAFFVLPATATGIGLAVHLEHAKSTEFCLSCHVMTPYGESLRIDSDEHLPAVHWQNALMPRSDACFACHTTYTMFGDLEAKMRGLRHVWVNYLGTVPETIALYEPYENRECFSCHAGARSFEEAEDHAGLREDLLAGDVSCLDCHDQVHDVAHLGELERWTGDRPEAAP